MIDVEGGTLTLKVYDEELKIDVRNTMRHKEDFGTSSNIQVFEQVEERDHVESVSKLPLERVLSMSIFEENEAVDSSEVEVVEMLNIQPVLKRSRTHRWEDLRQPIDLNGNEDKPKSSELKQLPENLKYVFLDTEKKCPAIISSNLQSVQEDRLIEVLRNLN